MRFVDIILKKKDGLELTTEEIKSWINGYIKDEIPDSFKRYEPQGNIGSDISYDE